MQHTTNTPVMVRTGTLAQALRDAAWRKFIDVNVSFVETGENDWDTELFVMNVLDAYAAL